MKQKLKCTLNIESGPCLPESHCHQPNLKKIPKNIYYAIIKKQTITNFQ